jgi:hypothetical protein
LAETWVIVSFPVPATKAFTAIHFRAPLYFRAPCLFTTSPPGGYRCHRRAAEPNYAKVDPLIPLRARLVTISFSVRIPETELKQNAWIINGDGIYSEIPSNPVNRITTVLQPLGFEEDAISPFVFSERPRGHIFLLTVAVEEGASPAEITVTPPYPLRGFCVEAQWPTGRAQLLQPAQVPLQERGCSVTCSEVHSRFFECESRSDKRYHERSHYAVRRLR